MKTLDVANTLDLETKVPDAVCVGDAGSWELICKVYSDSEGWMKSTKAMQVTGGCLVQVTTQQKNIDGTYSLAEALAFAPGCRVIYENGVKRLSRR